MTAFRLPDGGRIDRSQKLRFHFDGRPLEGYQGDTLASALLANDVFLVGRSFKYHRPRGVMSAGAEETNALVAVGEGGRLDTNSRATMVELYDGLVAQSLNRWPSLGFDVGAINGWLAPFLVAGFYYKTFMWPRRLWQFRAKRVVLATGAHERPLVFGGNDRPGVMLASAVDTYLRRYAVAPGKRVVVFTNNDGGHQRAKTFRELGIEVAAVIDSREGPVITRTLGGRRVEAVEVGGARIACDLVAMAGGWSPVVHLYSQAQGKLRWDEKKLCFVPDTCRQRVRVVGRANGEFPDHGIEPLWEVNADKAFVDFQSDVVSR